MLSRGVFALLSPGESAPSRGGRDMVDGLAAPRWACSFCELMGRKKACDVRDGTWLLPVKLGGRPPIDPDVLGVRLFLLFESARRSGCDGGKPVLEELPVLAVPGRESDTSRLLLGFTAVFGASRSPPSSEAISVMRDDNMLGGPATDCRGY